MLFLYEIKFVLNILIKVSSLLRQGVPRPTLYYVLRKEVLHALWEDKLKIQKFSAKYMIYDVDIQ